MDSYTSQYFLPPLSVDDLSWSIHDIHYAVTQVPNIDHDVLQGASFEDMFMENDTTNQKNYDEYYNAIATKWVNVEEDNFVN